MTGKIYIPEEIVSLLRHVEVSVANGKSTPAAYKEYGIIEQTYSHWCKEYDRLRVASVGASMRVSRR